MAERARLKVLGKVGRPVRFGALIALVVLAHSLALNRLSDALETPPSLKQMATPMFTRVLQPSEPPPIAAAPPEPSAPKVKRPAVTSLAKKAAPKPAKAASKPAPESTPAPAEVASAAPTNPSEPATEVAATPPQPPASAPASNESTASAPAAPASAPAFANDLDTWPADTRLNYRLSGWFRGELYGSARVQWQRDKDRYQNRVEIDIPPFAWITLTSQGDVTAQGLSPRDYEEQRRSSSRRVHLAEGDVTLNDGRRVPRPPEVQDTASQFVELAHRFATGRETLEVGSHIEFWLARPNGVDLWTYDIVDRQSLQLRGMGVVEAFHLKPRKITNPRGNFTAEIWFAPALQYLPVRIRINMGSDVFVELTAEKIEQR